MSSFNAENEHLIELTPPEILNESQNANDSLIPAKSKEKYLAAYDSFLQWKIKRKVQTISEDLFLAYFTELANTYKPSSLWCIYSMLRTIVNLKSGVDIKTYSKLIEFLKTRMDGYVGRKLKALSPADVEKFLKEAPDSRYLATKVALIFGVTGGCKRHELYNITTKDVETRGEKLIVKITKNKTKILRTFTIHGPHSKIVKKYQALRSTKTKNDRFFQNFQKGKCTAQTIGINKFGNMTREVARYLGLPEADLYSGHSFKKTSATMLPLRRNGGSLSETDAESYIEDSIHNKEKISDETTQAIDVEATSADSGASILTLKQEDRSLSDTDTESYKEDSMHDKAKISDKTSRDINLEPKGDSYFVCNSCGNYYDLPFSTFTHEETETSKDVPSTNVTRTVKLPSKTIQYRFENCSFTNCFNK